MARQYDPIIQSLTSTGSRDDRMRAVVDAIWNAHHTEGVSWVGFYVPAGADALVLAVCRDAPACSPIGLHGVCGAGLSGGKPIVVHDVTTLGAGYVACDPRDRSEIVIPCMTHGQCWGVLDLDSHRIGTFDEQDVTGLTRVLRAAGLTESAA